MSDIKLRSECGGWTSDSKVIPQPSKERNNLAVGTFNFSDQSWKDKAARKFMFTSETQKYITIITGLNCINYIRLYDWWNSSPKGWTIDGHALNIYTRLNNIFNYYSDTLQAVFYFILEAVLVRMWNRYFYFTLIYHTISGMLVNPDWTACNSKCLSISDSQYYILPRPTYILRR